MSPKPSRFASGGRRERREYVPVGSLRRIAAMDGGVPELQEQSPAPARERPVDRRSQIAPPPGTRLIRWKTPNAHSAPVSVVAQASQVGVGAHAAPVSVVARSSPAGVGAPVSVGARVAAVRVPAWWTHGR